jgi:hypothetical protein
MAVIGLTVGLIAGASGLAFAYFSSTGSGNGSAKTGTATNVSISQIGAGYDSLVATNSYNQDQCFSCASFTELGNDITLSTPDASQLVSVVVAVDNWGPEVNGVPMTFSINNTVNGPITDTISQDFAAAISSGTPSETNVTFDFSSQGAFVDPEFVYGISFSATPGGTPDPSSDSLNVALSASATDLSVGTDTHPGTIWLDGGYAGDNNLPTCTVGVPTAVFASIVSNCGPSNPADTGAYGNQTPAYDIPAVEVNVVGGSVTGLFPGDAPQPIEFAVTNSGTNPVQVASISVAVNLSGVDVATPANADVPGCLASWYQINNSPQVLGPSAGDIQPGTTIFTLTSPTASDLSIQMTNPAISQNACEGADVGLNFTAP